jgi:hypothetical protein
MTLDRWIVTVLGLLAIVGVLAYFLGPRRSRT